MPVISGIIRSHRMSAYRSPARSRSSAFRPSPTQVTLYSADSERRSAPRIIGSSSMTRRRPPCAPTGGVAVVRRQACPVPDLVPGDVDGGVEHPPDGHRTALVLVAAGEAP